MVLLWILDPRSLFSGNSEVVNRLVLRILRMHDRLPAGLIVWRNLILLGLLIRWVQRFALMVLNLSVRVCLSIVVNPTRRP